MGESADCEDLDFEDKVCLAWNLKTWMTVLAISKIPWNAQLCSFTQLHCTDSVIPAFDDAPDSGLVGKWLGSTISREQEARSLVRAPNCCSCRQKQISCHCHLLVFLRSGPCAFFEDFLCKRRHFNLSVNVSWSFLRSGPCAFFEDFLCKRRHFNLSVNV